MAQSLCMQIQQAAMALEDLLNLCPNQLDASIEAIDVTTIGDVVPRKCFSIKIISTQPVQIYPPK